MAKYDRIVTISKAMESQFIDNFPMLADKVRMIYNAKDIATLQAKANELARQMCDELLVNSVIEDYTLSSVR